AGVILSTSPQFRPSAICRQLRLGYSLRSGCHGARDRLSGGVWRLEPFKSQKNRLLHAKDDITGVDDVRQSQGTNPTNGAGMGFNISPISELLPDLSVAFDDQTRLR